jgi:preprotein translocase subunit SecG
MKKTAVLLIITFITLIALQPGVQANDSGVIVDREIVTISLTNKGLQVDETIDVTNEGSENVTSLRFWIQQNTQETPKIIEVPSGKELVPIITGNIRTCNLSAANLSIAPNATSTIQLTYYLPTTEQTFVKTLLYDTAIFSVTYTEGDTEWDLFQGEHLLYGADANNAIQIRLYKPTEAPLNITTLIIVFIIVIIVLALLLLMLKKQRSKTKKAVAETEETLTTKKSLLLSLLKDLEKQYRAQSISDETYTKIKDEYKQQAVDAMKKLDDLKK